MMGSRAIPHTAGKPSLEKSEQKGSPRCRFCHSRLRHAFVDLGMAPLSQSILNPEQLNHTEAFYPLHVHVCENCFLVQLEEYVSPVEIFTEYAYFSSYSDTWLEHAKAYVEMAVERFGLDGNSQVVEIGSNDGYLLQYFAMRQVNILGIEPAANVAEVAIRKGIPTVIRFFGERLARELSSQGKQADLLTGNNVLAHVFRDLPAIFCSRGHDSSEMLHLIVGIRTAHSPETVRYGQIHMLAEVQHLVHLRTAMGFMAGQSGDNARDFCRRPGTDVSAEMGWVVDSHIQFAGVGQVLLNIVEALLRKLRSVERHRRSHAELEVIRAFRHETGCCCFSGDLGKQRP